MNTVHVGLNGFGRIGRAFARIASNHPNISIEAINTGSSKPKSLAYSLQYDSVYRTFDRKISHTENSLVIDGKNIPCFNFRNPDEIPWADHQIDVVIDCTGVFKTREDLSKHIRGTVKKVIMTVPSKDESIRHVVLGVNDDEFDFTGSDIISNASCTTNCSAVMMKVLEKNFGVEHAMLSTVHSYTSSQALVDESSEKFTRGRSAGLSIIPTTTGASDAVCKVMKYDPHAMAGLAFRVPTPVGSLSDLVAILKRDTSIEELNQAFKSASENELRNILGYSEEELVSSDYIGSPFSCTFDANYTQVLNSRFVKVIGWYDNEWGYTSRVVDLVERLGQYI